MSNSLDPDQARQNVGPDLGLNCLSRLLADGTDLTDFNQTCIMSICGIHCPLDLVDHHCCYGAVPLS